MSGPVRENQEEAFSCLAQLAGGQTDAAKRIDTHANVVFIGVERVYKMKRAVQYPFLDYSTLALRYRYCASEVVLNRRTAPDLYLGVIPILRLGEDVFAGRLLANPDPEKVPSIAQGDVVDWAVVMQRFDEDALFDRLAERNCLTPAHLRGLGERIASFHRAAAPVRNAWSEIEKDVLTDNLAEIAEAEWIAPDKIAAHTANSTALFETLRERLDDRSTERFVRQCHGDMHLQNIVLLDGQPTLFDCIEFSDDFSQIDCLYDLAFLLMDLEHREMPGAACKVLNRYLEETGDYAGAGLLPFYTALRAQVRAKIEIATVGFAETEENAAAHRRSAEAYLDLACRAIDRPPARVVAVGGPSGSGKSTLAAAIAEQMAKSYGPSVLVLRSDQIRKSLWGVAETTPLPQEAYAPSVSIQVYSHMHSIAATALEQGLPVVLDATHTHPDSRRAAEDIAAKLSIPFQGIWANAPKDVLIARVTQRSNDASDADAAVVQQQLRQDWGKIDWPEIDTSIKTGTLTELATAQAAAIDLIGPA